MRQTFFTLILAMLICLACQQEEQKRELCFQTLQEQFANPSSEFRSAPLWVWNSDVTTGDIDRMLAELKEQGFGGAFVHPRPGLETEYLSQEWFDLWDYSLQKGKELGLDIWIYDENSYPSGFAGDKPILGYLDFKSTDNLSTTPSPYLLSSLHSSNNLPISQYEDMATVFSCFAICNREVSITATACRRSSLYSLSLNGLGAVISFILLSPLLKPYAKVQLFPHIRLCFSEIFLNFVF